jgi:hypothetical protein
MKRKDKLFLAQLFVANIYYICDNINVYKCQKALKYKY